MYNVRLLYIYVPDVWLDVDLYTHAVVHNTAKWLYIRQLYIDCKYTRDIYLIININLIQRKVLKINWEKLQKNK